MRGPRQPARLDRRADSGKGACARAFDLSTLWSRSHVRRRFALSAEGCIPSPRV